MEGQNLGTCVYRSNEGLDLCSNEPFKYFSILEIQFILLFIGYFNSVPQLIAGLSGEMEDSLFFF